MIDRPLLTTESIGPNQEALLYYCSGCNNSRSSILDKKRPALLDGAVHCCTVAQACL